MSSFLGTPLHPPLMVPYAFFSVTTVATTTYSTETTTTLEREYDSCPDCVRKDFIFIPKKLYYEPITGEFLSHYYSM